MALGDSDSHVLAQSADLSDDAGRGQKRLAVRTRLVAQMKYEAPDFERLEELFHASSELDAAARKEFLDANCSLANVSPKSCQSVCCKIVIACRFRFARLDFRPGSLCNTT